MARSALHPRRKFSESNILDIMTKHEIEEALSERLPQCTICCSINPDGTLTVSANGRASEEFTIINIERAHYHGDDGVTKLAREIMEEMVMSRQTSLL